MESLHLNIKLDRTHFHYMDSSSHLLFICPSQIWSARTPMCNKILRIIHHLRRFPFHGYLLPSAVIHAGNSLEVGCPRSLDTKIPWPNKKLFHRTVNPDFHVAHNSFPCVFLSPCPSYNLPYHFSLAHHYFFSIDVRNG